MTAIAKSSGNASPNAASCLTNPERWISSVRSTVPTPAAAAPSYIGRDVHLHPRAFVEGAYIEDGARLEANCSVRFSYIGAGCEVGDLGRIRHCCIGPQTQTLLDASLAHTVALGGGTVSNLSLRDSALGTNVFLTTGVSMATDARGGTVTVLKDGEEVPEQPAYYDSCREVLDAGQQVERLGVLGKSDYVVVDL